MKTFFMKTVMASASLMALVGCASVMNETTQSMKIETKTAEGENVQGAQCTFLSERGTQNFLSGGILQVNRSSKDLEITCKFPGKQDAKAQVISRLNGGMAGNIIFGGGIGAVIDHSKGTAYTYPQWIQLVSGKKLVFDRADENEGSPVQGKEPTK